MTWRCGHFVAGWVWLSALIAMPLPSGAQGSAAIGDGQAGSAAGGQGVRGTVTVALGDRLTLKTETGETYQVLVTPNTRLVKDQQPVKIADIHAGDGVGAMGVMDAPAKTVHALMVMVVSAEQIKKAREAMGKTYIAGKITAIDLDNLKLTVLRQDSVSQVIVVDEGTSFKRGGRGIGVMQGFGMGPGVGNGSGGEARAGRQARPEESITLADVKVGDNILGPGALKSGTFVPTELHVATPGAGRGHGRDGGPANRGAGQVGAPPPVEPQ